MSRRASRTASASRRWGRNGSAGLRAARAALLAGLLAGAILGTARMLQGAHFLSHTLWTLWLAWGVSISLAVALRADLYLGDRRRD